MSLSPKALEILNRPLNKDDIKTRPGKAGMNFNYVSPDFVIRSLNEAFEHQWSTKIVFQEVIDNVAIVGLQLCVSATDGSPVCKEQFGSCEITRGLGVGEAFKGAASDALKKCATLLGLALELYEDKDPGDAPSFRPPAVGGGNKNAFQTPSKPGPTIPPPPPRFQAPVPPPTVKEPASIPPRPMAPPPFPPKPPMQQQVAAPAKKLVNPFVGSGSGEINTTQLNSLTNIATRKNMSQAELIALAGIVDNDGQAVSSFEELKYDQAISVIQAASR